jgi:hypothetical protein
MTFSPKLRDENENVQMYTAGTINQLMHLTQGGMILIALLRGGDYDKVPCLKYFVHQA